MKRLPSTPALELSHVTKSYGTSRGIENISLTISQGEIFGFLGPNGAGKSTTINTILDLLRPNSGTIEVLGLDAHDDSVQVHRHIGYLAGDMETDSSLTGKQYLQYAAHLRGGVSAEAVDKLVKQLRCETNKKIKHLSRGNRQKIGLVSALMHDPDVLILDEPTSGLDPLVQNEFNAIIRDHAARGKTTFMSSHVLSEVQAACHRIGFIRDGKLIRVSTLEELLENVAHRVSALYPSGAPDSRLRTLKGVSDFHIHGKRRAFTFSGDYTELLHILATKPISDLQILEPALDELFMEYYSAPTTKKGRHV